MENDGDLKNQFFINRNFITALIFFYARFIRLKIICDGMHVSMSQHNRKILSLSILKYLFCYLDKSIQTDLIGKCI